MPASSSYSPSFLALMLMMGKYQKHYLDLNKPWNRPQKLSASSFHVLVFIVFEASFFYFNYVKMYVDRPMSRYVYWLAGT